MKRSLLLFVLLMAPAGAVHFRRDSAISLKKRLHVNTLITEPGTVEIDWAGMYSLFDGSYSLPAMVKWTPRGRAIWWGRTEYGLAIDTANGQSATLVATSVLLDGEHLDVAIAPAATVFLRGESGARLGATAIARWDVGRDSWGATAGWSGATHASPTNPAGTFDLGTGYGHVFGKFTPHVNAQWERSTGVQRIWSALEGVEYQISERFALDVSGAHIAAKGNGPNHQLIFGITVNVGHPR